MTLTSSYQYIGRTDGVKCSAGWIYYVLLYAKTTGSIATGKHTVTMLMRLVCDRNATFKGFATTGSATVDGAAAISWANQSNPSADWPSGSITEGGYTYQRWTDLAEGSVEVNTGYGVDKNVTLAVSWQRLARSTTPPTYVPGTSVISGAFTVTLPMIAGASKPTLSAGTVEMGNPVMVYTNPLPGGFTHRLTYAFGAASGVIAEACGGSAPWTPSVELARQIPSATVGIGSVYCQTYQNGVQIGDTTSVGITLTVPNNIDTQPSVSMTLSPVSSLAAPFNALYIQNLTKVDADLSAIGKYGASIKSYQMVVGGGAYGSPYTSGYLTQIGNVAVTGKATDSRGYVGSTQQTISVIPYARPAVVPASGQTDIVCARCDEGGNFTDSGTYLRIIAKRSYSSITSGGVQHNFCQLRYRCDGGSWKDILAVDAGGDEVDTGAISGVVTSTTSSYTIEIGVVDTIGNTASVTKIVPTEQVDFHLREGGKGAAFGEYAEEENVFSVASDWTSKFKGDVCFQGGLYCIAEDGEKEWLFPPMIPGVEYRTPERFNEKPVYIKCLAQTFPGTSGSTSTFGDISVEHGISGLSIALRATGSFSLFATNDRYMMPYVDPTGGMVVIDDVTSTSVTIRLYKAQYTYLTVLIYLYYTKEE